MGGLKFCAITTQFQAPPKVVKEHSTWANFPPDNSRGGLNVGGRRKPTRKQSKIRIYEGTLDPKLPKYINKFGYIWIC